MAELNSSPILRLQNIRRNFGDVVVTKVLKGIDLEIYPGEFASLVGPSGSGKSTLLNIMGLLDRPTSGQVLVHGDNTSDLDDTAITRLRGRTLGFVFQFHHLLTAFTVLENVMMPAALDRGEFSDAMSERARELLDAVGIGSQADKNAREISGGQQQRVAIARALMMEPDLVLADEPTGNLDTESAAVVFELLEKINKQTDTAFLLVTHDSELAQSCERELEIVDGQLIRGGGLERGDEQKEICDAHQ